MSRRVELRQRYMAGWYEADAGKLVSACAPGFLFDDPAEPAPVGRDGLASYMRRWLDRVGGANEWRLAHEVRVDRDGILTDWEWWELPGAGLSGMAVITTGDDGVLLERITYFENAGRRVS